MAWDRIADEHGVIRFRNSDREQRQGQNMIPEQGPEERYEPEWISSVPVHSDRLPETASPEIVFPETASPETGFPTGNPSPRKSGRERIWLTSGLAVIAALMIGGLFSVATIRFFEPGPTAGETGGRHSLQTEQTDGGIALRASGNNVEGKKSLYAVQCGVFSSAESAEKFRQQLQQSGFPAVTVASGPFRVLAYLTGEPETADRVIKRIRAAGGDAILKTHDLTLTDAQIRLLHNWMAGLEPCLLNGEKGCLSAVKREQLLAYHKDFLEQHKQNDDVRVTINRIAQMIIQAEQAEESAFILYVAKEIQQVMAG